MDQSLVGELIFSPRDSLQALLGPLPSPEHMAETSLRNATACRIDADSWKVGREQRDLRYSDFLEFRVVMTGVIRFSPIWGIKPCECMGKFQGFPGAVFGLVI